MPVLAQLWASNQLSAQGPIRKLTAYNYHNRLTPETASAGFIALHTAEVIERFARMMFGRELTIQPQTLRVSDDGRPLDLAGVHQRVEDGFAMIADHIQQTNDDQWNEIITTPFGDISRMQALSFLMHHNSYHAGQIAQAIKKGKEFTDQL